MKDDADWTEAILRLRTPLQPQPTEIASRLKPLADVRAVIFDIYGTLLISGSGDVGTADTDDHQRAFNEAFQAVGLSLAGSSPPSAADLKQKITELNAQRQGEQCPKPEVDVVDAWRQMLADHDCHPDTKTTVRLASEYEARANPTWPMPGAETLLADLRQAGFQLGIVSNAQVFTVPLVQALLDRPQLDHAFALDLCIFSNRFRQAKPGPKLFDVLCGNLQRLDIRPDQALYVGNDMLNDVWAADQAGLQTAWFAGDARSCRPRSEHERCRSLQPDVVLTELMQLHCCLKIQ